MNIFGKLFGSDTALKAARDGIDAVWFTNEEKATQWIKVLTAYEAFKVAQRCIALIVVTPFVGVHLLGMGLFVVSLFMDPCIAGETCKSSQIFAGSKTIVEWNNEQLGMPVSLILAFYFGGGMLEGGIHALKGKK